MRSSAARDFEVKTPEYHPRMPTAICAWSLLATAAALLPAAPAAATEGRSASLVDLSAGWRVTQDVRGLGEKNGWPEAATPVDWQPLPRLAHLQLLFSAQPYFGRELRQFNAAAWWYRLDFPTPPGASFASLQFEGVDYHATVWLNGTRLGAHEGYADPFEFEVGGLLSHDGPNRLVVQVSSPWDHEYLNPKQPIFAVVRRMLKGSYEHADTFVQRDVNPVGIWRPVRLLLHDGLRESGPPWVRAFPAGAARDTPVVVQWPVANAGVPRDVELTVRLRSTADGAEAARVSRRVRLAAGESTLEAKLALADPRHWSTWDHGGPALYEAELSLEAAGAPALRRRVSFGVRSVELRRSASETRFFLDGKPLYVRGTSYWPDVYLSNVDEARYERDLRAAMQAGVNAVRVHVHSENPELYELCDRLGIVVLQDFDLNWVFPTDEDFTRRAVELFGRTIRRLRNHPSIVGWIAINEAYLLQADRRAVTTAPGPQLVAEAKRLDPDRPVIKNSMDRDDVESGDGHDYRGSLAGGAYTDVFGSTEKLATEFGVDAPPSFARLRAVPQLAERLASVAPRLGELHDYQYRLLKYYVEHYRMQKYAPNAGYFQFMWIDFCPQSFYGVYDYWGAPKVEGLGGGLRALRESNQPIGVFMEHKDGPVALHAVNDSDADLGECVARWRVTRAGGEIVTQGTAALQLAADSHARVTHLTFAVDPAVAYEVVLDLATKAGRPLAHNVYVDPFRHPARPEGYPSRMDDELGMRLWWAGLDRR
jgi:beta-mannosidase